MYVYINFLEITITRFPENRLPCLAALFKNLASKILDSIIGKLY